MLAILILALLSILVVVYIAIRIPQVQQYTLKHINVILQEELDTKVEVGEMELDPLQQLVLRNIYVEDQQGDTLLYARKLRVDFDIFNLWNKTIQLDIAELDNAVVNIYREQGQEEFNYQFILDAFETTEPTEPSEWFIQADELLLSSVRFNYLDEPEGLELNAQTQRTVLNIENLGLENNHLILNYVAFHGLNITFNQLEGKQITDREAIAEETPDTTSEDFFVTVHQLDVTGSSFAFNDLNQAPTEEGIDFNRLKMQNITAALENIIIHGDHIKGDLHHLSLKEQSGFELKNLALSLEMEAPALDVEITKLSTPHSRLDSIIKVHIPELDKIEEQAAELTAHADLRNTVISPKDIFYFAPDLELPEELREANISLTGDLRGTVGNLSFRNFLITLEDKAQIAGNLSVKGLPEAENAHFDLNLKEGKIQQRFLAQFLPPQGKLPVNIGALGNIRTAGRISGQMHDVSARLNTTTALGGVATNVKVRTDNDFNLKEHSGDIRLQKFQAGRFMQSEDLGQLTASLTYQGSGTDIQSFFAEISSVIFNQYNYRNLQAEGQFIKDQLKAEITTRDPNLESFLTAEADLRQEPFNYRVNGSINQANLHELNLNEDTFCFSTKVYADITGTNPDSLTGIARFDQLKVENPKINYQLDSIVLSSAIENGHRNLNLTSPILNASASGVFNYSDIPDAAQHFISNYTSAVTAPKKTSHVESLNFEVSLRNISDLLEVFAPDVQKFDTLHTAGTFRGAEHVFTMETYVGDFTYNNQQIKNAFLDINADKDSFNFNVTSNALVSGDLIVDKPAINGSLFNDSLFVNVQAAQRGAENNIDLDAFLTHHQDTFKVNLPRALITLGGNNWTLEPGNEILYSDEYLAINDLEMYHSDQRLEINTRRKKSQDDLVNVQLEKIKIEDLAELAGIKEYELEGRLNGIVDLTNPLTGLGINADLNLDSVFVTGEQLGKISLQAHKLQNRERIDTEVSVEGPGNDAFISGYLDAGASPAELDFRVNVKQLSMGRIQPFLKDIFTTLDGTMAADLHINGTTETPLVTGRVLFKDRNTIGLALTQTDYRVTNQEIIFNEESIELKNFTLTDMQKRPAVINGYVYHKTFDDLRFDMSFTADNFELLNSPRAPDALFYGRLLASVNMLLKGPVEDLDIDLGITTEGETELFLQLLADENVIRPPYIIFKGEEEEDIQKSLVPGADTEEGRIPTLDIARFNFHSRITITPDAEFTIVVDPANGDKITARGEGDIQLRLDEDDNINLFGAMTIKEGSYSMAFLNMINREFKIRSGSTISWSGDPEDPLLNITALYETRAARIDLVPDLIDMMSPEEVRAARRNLPVRVAMKMTGGLTEPEIGFDLEIPEATASADAAVVNQRVEQIRNNETELNKQVFGLIVLNRFIYDGVGTTDTGEDGILLGQAGQSISRILNRQLEALSDQYLGGIELEVNVQALDQREGPFAQNVEIQASRQISQRVTVTAGGTVNVGTSERSGQFAGDYAVLYRINETGNVNIRFFRTSHHNLYTDNLTTRTGASINHHKDFDSIIDLWPW